MRIKSIVVISVVISMAMLIGQPLMAQDAALKPYTARYSVQYRGISGGAIEFTLKSEGNGRYVYSSHLLPNFLGSLFASDQAEDTSQVSIMDGENVQPLHFKSDDGTQSTEKDIRYDFDWTKNSVSGRYKNNDFTMNVPRGVQDRLSIQLAAMLSLQAGRDPGKLIMLEKDELQEYVISRQGSEHIKVPAGEYDALVLNSVRDGSSRSTRYWYAAKSNYVLVRAERISKGKVDIVMELTSVKFE